MHTQLQFVSLIVLLVSLSTNGARFHGILAYITVKMKFSNAHAHILSYEQNTHTHTHANGM